MDKRDDLEEGLARALHTALIRAAPHAWNSGTADDAAEWREMSFDGTFKPRLVAKYLLAYLSPHLSATAVSTPRSRDETGGTSSP